MNCKRCNSEFNTKGISEKWISKNPEKYLLCSDCRNYRYCPICNNEFYHIQNQTCSKECAKKLKEESFLKSCGTKHNFFKNSISRVKWERRLEDEEGIKNVFQRESIKNKIKKYYIENYGVDNVSQISHIKDKKSETLKNTLSKNPNLYKENWKRVHENFIREIGIDPRLHTFGKASIESLLVFNEVEKFCLENGIDGDDIFIGKDERKEYFIQTKKKIYFYDFTIKSLKLIIEYHGVTFHVNPNNSDKENWRNPFTNEGWKENIYKTKVKNNAALRRGFKILEIWSDEEVKTNIEKCIEFINQNKTTREIK
jgi:very-short-patch-repair endonuclease